MLIFECPVRRDYQPAVVHYIADFLQPWLNGIIGGAVIERDSTATGYPAHISNFHFR